MNTPKESKLQLDVTRRDFLKSTSTLAAAAALAPGVFAASNDTLKLALIGCGGRGTAACGQALSTTGPLKLVAMADVHKDHLDGSYDGLKQKHQDRVEVPEDQKFIGFDAYKRAIAFAPQAEAAKESRGYMSSPYRRSS